MAEKKKAKFSVGQVVRKKYGDGAFCRVVRLARVSKDGIQQYILDTRFGTETYIEWWLRPLTSREIGPRPRPQPRKK